MKTVRQIFKFGVVGVLNTLVDLGLLNLLVYFGMAAVLANTISFSAAAVNSFFWNKFWTFRERERAWQRQIIPFIIVVTVGLVMSDLLIYYFHTQMGYNLNLVKIASVVVIFWWNFFIPKLFIFKT
jgi:putative flippase GtrA